MAGKIYSSKGVKLASIVAESDIKRLHLALGLNDSIDHDALMDKLFEILRSIDVRAVADSSEARGMDALYQIYLAISLSLAKSFERGRLGVASGLPTVSAEGDGHLAHEFKERLVEATISFDSAAISRLDEWFRDAKRHNDGVSDGLPFPAPGLIYKQDLALQSSVDGNVSLVSGWISVADSSVVLETDLGPALVEAYRKERETVDRWLRDLPDLILGFESHVDEVGKEEVDAAIAAVTDYIERSKKFVALNDYWRQQRQGRGKANLGDGSDQPSAQIPNMPWWDLAEVEGLVTAEAAAHARSVSGKRWAWDNEEVVVGEGPADEDLVRKLMQHGGFEEGARLARLAIRFGKILDPRPDATSAKIWNEKHYRPYPSNRSVRAYDVEGEPDPNRLSTRILTDAERARLFGKTKQVEGSAGVKGFRLPVGSVIVIEDDTSAYLRGRGWSVGLDRRLVAWNWRGESEVLPVGGWSETPAAEGDLLENRTFGVTFHGFCHDRGTRWWNVYGDGNLFDETLFEWEDRRRRMEKTAWDIMVSGTILTPSEMKFYLWSLMGHVEDESVAPPGLGEWRPKVRKVHPLGDELKLVARPMSFRSEWSDVVKHDRRWASLLPAWMRDHDVMKVVTRRKVEGTPDVVDFWRRVIESIKTDPAFDPDQPDHPDRVKFLKLRERVFSGIPGEEWDRLGETNRRHQESVDELFDDLQAGHHSWMTKHARIVLVTKEGVLESIPWDPMAFPEPLIAPKCMEIPIVSRESGIDFSTFEDQGNGTPGRPARHMQDDYVISMTNPGMSQRLKDAESILLEPVEELVGGDLAADAGVEDEVDALMLEAARLISR